MQLSFDPRDPNEAANVLAILDSLHPGLVTESQFSDAALEPIDSAPDAAEAFGAGPFVPVAPTAAPVAPTAAPVAPTAAPVAPTAAPVAPTAAPVAPSLVDSAGVPWDARIHSGPPEKKPTNSDGTWRRKRGTSDDDVARVTAEIMAAAGLIAAPVPPAPPAPEVAAVPVPPPPPPPPAPVPVAESAPVAAPPAPPVTPVAAPAVSGAADATVADDDAPATNFATLMRKVTKRQTAGIMTVEETTAIAKSLGIESLRGLMARPDLVASFDALLPPLAA